VDLAQEQRVQRICRTGIAQGWVQAAHDVSDGGVLIALAEMAIAGDCGVQITVNVLSTTRWDEFLFGEGGSRIWVTVAPEYRSVWESYITEELPGAWGFWGMTGGDALVIQTAYDPMVNLPIADMRHAWASCFPRRLEA